MAEGQKPTINDVARLSGVSKKTVSRVINKSPLLNASTREKVESVIAELGYVPNPQARALALRRNFLIGLIHDNPNAQMVLGVQEGILDTIRDTEFALVVHPVNRYSPTLHDDIRRFIEQQRLYGVMLLPPLSERDDLADLCRDLGCTVVRMGSARLDEDAHLVASNDRQAVREAVGWLAELGHSRIGFVAGPEGFRSANEREQGFLEGLAGAGLSPDPAIMARGTYRFESGKAAGEKLLAADIPPTAVFSSNDEMAAGILHAARERGLNVPDDLSIIGFDDTATAAHIWPPLTTVRWPIRAMAKTAAAKLIRPASAASEPSFFLSDLIRRASAVPRSAA
ncbi:LacI family DNA-binding transcriptional regulator [Novosphingobium panipatense]|jgi:LacI family transcriptional regulator|uniref:Transcriptional regulator, LacI family n=1 Tax=Novosphingobium panipatense TaxID=428991 RepID=A0ABY1QC16_9SPHN|nr:MULTISPECIES: LacI family DNA-binding transcriptional regulator [Novosphingobium]SMP67031.1 transcriptional regulator, LacI family [Novosphingobium panipatense]